MVDAVFLVHLVSTLSMVGLIWFVQVVHYPLMRRVPPGAFCGYEREHQRRTGAVVVPLMCSEAVTALLLLRVRPDGVPLEACVTGLVLLVAVWLSTFLWQAPLHGELARQHDPGKILRLIRSNWLRTVAWSARGFVVVWMALARFAGGAIDS